MIVKNGNQTNSEQNPNFTIADFRSVQTIGNLVFWFFVAGMITDLLSVGSSVLQIDLLQKMESGGNWTEAEVGANDTREMIIGWIVVAVSLGGMICFLFWFNRARANLPALGINDARWSPRWAVGWWFIPVFGLFRPYQIAKEIWKASSLTATAVNWREESVPSILKIWWGMFVLGSILYNISFRMMMNSSLAKEPTFSSLINASIMDAVASSIWFLATIPAIMVVKKVTQRQAEKATVLVDHPKPSLNNAKFGGPRIETNPLPTVQRHISTSQNNIQNTGPSTPSSGSVTHVPIEQDTERTIPEEKECPRCAEVIKLKAKYCRFCKYEYSEAEFEAEKMQLADNLAERLEREREEVEERRKVEEETLLKTQGISYKGYTIRKSDRGQFEVFELGIKLRGSSDYTSIEKAKQYVNLISSD